MTRCARTANGATRREWSRQLPGTPRPPSTRAATPTPPNDALWGESRHDHPDAPARRRGHPWPLEHASAVPTIAGHGAQRAVHNPAAEAHPTSTRRSDDQKPCSGRNLDRESPPIIHGAPDLLTAGPAAALTPWRLAGNALPTEADRARICNLSPATVVAGRLDAALPRYEPAVERTLHEAAISRRSATGRMGHVRASLAAQGGWDIERVRFADHFCSS